MGRWANGEPRVAFDVYASRAQVLRRLKLDRRMLKLVRIFVAVLASCCFGGAAYAQSYNDVLGIVPPVAAGRYPVGCSSVEQDFSRVSGSDATAYWEGRGGGGSAYVTDLLVDPTHSFVVNVPVPDDRDLFGDFRGRTMVFANLVCYPTTDANGHADYTLPNGKVVPRMQRGADPPIFAADRQRYPVLLFSHGFGGSPISSDYIEVLKLFASHGYVTVAPFHGDSRIVDARIDTLDELLRAFLDFPNYTAMQALRPLALTAALDAVLGNPAFAARIDASRIGGFGASQGGESLLLMRGARLSVSVGLSSKAIINDTRLKAAVGYVPYFGQPFFPAFGRDLQGLDGVDLPYLAIAGGADTTAPAEVTAIGMSRLAGVRQFVVLEGVRHGFDPANADDIFTWALTFLGAYVDDDPLARATSARMTRVAGGGNDVLLLDRAQPLPPGPGERIAIEYYNGSLDHYFMTADSSEIAILDAGTIPGWQRTGFAFNVYAPDSSVGTPACRFFGKPGIGPNSHFFTILPNECQDVMNNPLWLFEGLVFRAEAPDGIGACSADRVPVIRMYNNGKGGQANHRYLTSHSEIGAMLGEGWIVEGPVFCTPP
jgi:predicted dienelactone hydrolase